MLHWVRHERAERDKEYRRRQLEAKREQRDQKEARIEDWERRLLGEEIAERLKCMWEVSLFTLFTLFTFCSISLFGEALGFKLSFCANPFLYCLI